MNEKSLMRAKRKLDALVAKKVFEWKVIETEDCNGIDNFWLSKDGKNVWEEGGFYFELPQYSADIASAFLIVEAFRRGGIQLEGRALGTAAACMDLHLSDACEEEDWYCTFYAPDLAKHEVFASSAPLAICRAALAAVEYRYD